MDEDGFSMIATLLSLVASALLVALLLGSTFHSGNTPGARASSAPAVRADSLQAQQALSTGLATADASAQQSGGYATLSPAALSAAEPSLTFVTGSSANPMTISMAVGPDPAGAPNAGTGGSITLADRSADGTCWLLWKGAGGDTWYGAQTGLSSCAAPVLSSSPTPGAVSSTTIGWQQGGFPAP